jgi:Na+-driven multidrug efflux pump
MSLVGMLYNFQLMKYAGENGVAAYGVLMYVSMIFMAIFIGYSIGMAPPIGFHYGAGNCGELKNLLKKSLTVISVTAVCMMLLSFVLAEPLSRIFVGYDPSLFSLTRRGFNIYAFSFLFSGFAVFGSCFFTALNNGLVSAIISFMRTMVFQISAVLILPLLLDMDGIWLSVVVSDLLSVVVTAVLLLTQRAKYKY